jgi:peptidoglycan hydrolase CwlO-like protein
MRKRFLSAIVFGCVVMGAARCLAKDSVKAKRDGLKQIQTAIDEKKKEKKSATRRAQELRQEVDRISNELQSARKALSTGRRSGF